MEDGFGLRADTHDVIDDNESAIGDSKCSSDLGGEIDMAW